MADLITKTYHEESGVINQCDIFRDVEYIEYAVESEDAIEVSKIHFPYVIVLTQACDLLQDHNSKERIKKTGDGDHDKYLLSALVAPLYKFEDVRTGTHLEQLDMKMQELGRRTRSRAKNIIINENKRYHYLQFDDIVPIPESVIDFKHYFSVSMSYLAHIYNSHYVCSIKDLYRESISHRFAHFLSRIGLPDQQ